MTESEAVMKLKESLDGIVPAAWNAGGAGDPGIRTPEPEGTGAAASVVSLAAGGDPEAKLAERLAELRQALTEQTQVLRENSQAIAENTAKQGGGAAEGLKTAARSGASWLTSAFPLAGMVTGLVRAFGKSGAEEPPPLAKYTLPASLEYRAGVTASGGMRPYDYDGEGKIRPVSNAREGGGTNGVAPQVVVQVNAMDSRSFLDHSGEIARAVREAMLQSHSLNDVIAEL